jgi:phosphatidylglycerophosphatase C
VSEGDERRLPQVGTPRRASPDGGGHGRRDGQAAGGIDVAAFDLDGTLTRGDSLLSFLRFSCGAARTARALGAELSRFVEAASTGGAARDRAKEALLSRCLSGRRESDLAAAAEEFSKAYLARRSRPEALTQVAWHRRRGHRLVVISASPEIYVIPMGRQLGVDAVLATRLETDGDGRLTGRFDGSNCRGEEKVARLVRWRGGIDGRIWAYGDSSGDAELLALADVAVRVGRRWPHLTALETNGESRQVSGR